MSTQSTLRFMDSCQHYDGSQIMRKWILTTGTPNWLATGGRRGAGALAISAGGKLGWTFPSPTYGMASGSIGAAFNWGIFPGAPFTSPVMSFSTAPNANPDFALQVDSTGHFSLTVGNVTVASNASYAITTARWYYGEFAFWLSQHISGGDLIYRWNFQAWISESDNPATRTLVLAAANVATLAPASVTNISGNEGLIPSGVPNVFFLHGVASGASIWCDIWACGSSASPMTDQGGGVWYDIPQTFGDVRVDAVRRISDTSAHATPSTGGNHYAMVGDAAPDDYTTNLAYPSLGVQDLGLFGPFPLGTFIGAQFISAVAKDCAGPGGFKQVWHVGGADHTDGAIYAPSANAWPYVCTPRSLDIDSGTPYTTAILAATEFGIERTA